MRRKIPNASSGVEVELKSSEIGALKCQASFIACFNGSTNWSNSVTQRKIAGLRCGLQCTRECRARRLHAVSGKYACFSSFPRPHDKAERELSLMPLPPTSLVTPDDKANDTTRTQGTTILAR